MYSQVLSAQSVVVLVIAVLLLLDCCCYYTCWELPRSSPRCPDGWNYQQQAKKKFLINRKELELQERNGLNDEKHENRYIEIVYDADRDSYAWFETTTTDGTVVQGGVTAGWQQQQSTGRTPTGAKRVKMGMSDLIEDVNSSSMRIRRRR
eukprot:GHVS01032092.1.p1 GENE.GHVS01032092.1~~GHVS01032092.1.p1  ORF type:complete len:150 (+),score=27.95 GHVS01032092.1:244-693(+)